MQIEHISIWTKNIEQIKAFYEDYFEAKAGNKYTNADREFESCFLSFSSGARLELMQIPTVLERPGGIETQYAGYAHLAFSVGSEKQVDALTAQLEQDGYQIINGPRHTGDGYYESVIVDPDHNLIEITI